MIKTARLRTQLRGEWSNGCVAWEQWHGHEPRMVQVTGIGCQLVARCGGVDDTGNSGGKDANTDGATCQHGSEGGTWS